MNRKKILRQMASALILSGGVRKEEVTGLSVLVDMDNVRAALTYLRDRSGKLTEAHVNHVWLLRTIARHWLMDEATSPS